MRHRVVIIACLILLGTWKAHADEEPTEEQVDGVLTAFCAESMLFDRGFTNTLFAGSADEWIATRLANDVAFQTALGLTEQQVNRLLGPPSTPFSVEEAAEGWPHADDRYSGHLRSILTEDQKALLPNLYLHLEGMPAVLRPEFTDLIGITAEEQTQIRKLAEEAFSEAASPIHRGIFTARSQEELQDYLPFYHAELRKAAAALDAKILMTLSPDARRRLLPIIRKGRPLRAVVYGAGPMGPAAPGE